MEVRHLEWTQYSCLLISLFHKPEQPEICMGLEGREDMAQLVLALGLEAQGEQA